MPRRVHVVGAGLAGLSAAVALAQSGHEIVLYEAGRHAGGRCRSYFDAGLGCRIDNGNHLLLSGNSAAMAYLRRIGALATLTGPRAPRFDFCDLATGARWTLAPGPGRLPWWILDRRRRVPGTRAVDYLRAAALGKAGPDQTVAQVLDTDSVLYRRLWAPFALAALNTEPEFGSAALLAQIMRESFGAGGAALRPLVPRLGLSESLIDPALAFLEGRGAQIRFGWRLRGLAGAGNAVESLDFDAGAVSLAPGEGVVLAVPAAVATRLLPEMTAPSEFRAILNGHYRIAVNPALPLVIGLLGGTAEWVFRKAETVSVTVSAADRMIDEPAAALAARLWHDVARAYGLAAEPQPAWRIVKEKRASFAATPAQERRRPGPATRWRNLVLAGDWTATGLPATIEGAIRSGMRAAALADDSRAEPFMTKDLSAGQSDSMLTPEPRVQSLVDRKR